MAVLVVASIGACTGGSSLPASQQSPEAYLKGALDWIEAHAVHHEPVDWASLRREALAVAPDPRTPSDTYPALRLALRRLHDFNAFFVEPGPAGKNPKWLGLEALAPSGVVVDVMPGGPAERAGVRVGDVIETVNDGPPRPQEGTTFLDRSDGSSMRLALRRPGQDQPVTVAFVAESFTYESKPVGRRLTSGPAGIGYLELPWDLGLKQYPTRVQRLLRSADQTPACGWIVDLRRNVGGDFWSYLAALGPILGEGDLGGFVYPSGERERWEYRAGKVRWDGKERPESFVDGSVYRLKRPMPPVALLTSPATAAAGELLVVAFRGRPNTRTFGEPTAGSPGLLLSTPLSDGARIFVSGAFSEDRTGRRYDGRIAPDEPVATDWTAFGSESDPAVQAALQWLRGQPGCAQ